MPSLSETFTLSLVVGVLATPPAHASGLCELKAQGTVVSTAQVSNGGTIAIDEHGDPSDVVNITILNLPGPNSRVTATRGSTSIILDLDDNGQWEAPDGGEQLRSWLLAAGLEQESLEAAAMLLLDQCGFEGVSTSTLTAVKEAL